MLMDCGDAVSSSRVAYLYTTRARQHSTSVAFLRRGVIVGCKTEWGGTIYTARRSLLHITQTLPYTRGAAYCRRVPHCCKKNAVTHSGALEQHSSTLHKHRCTTCWLYGADER